jgi:hypothetical protein
MRDVISTGEYCSSLSDDIDLSSENYDYGVDNAIWGFNSSTK